MTTNNELKQLRSQAHWRTRIARTEKELADKQRLYDKISSPAKRDLGRYISHLEKTLVWLRKMA